MTEIIRPARHSIPNVAYLSVAPHEDMANALEAAYHPKGVKLARGVLNLLSDRRISFEGEFDEHGHPMAARISSCERALEMLHTNKATLSPRFATYTRMSERLDEKGHRTMASIDYGFFMRPTGELKKALSRLWINEAEDEIPVRVRLPGNRIVNDGPTLGNVYADILTQLESGSTVHGVQVSTPRPISRRIL